MKNQVLFINTNVTLSAFGMHESAVSQGAPITQNFFVLRKGEKATIIREEKDMTVILANGNVIATERGTWTPAGHSKEAILFEGNSLSHGRPMKARIQV